MHTDHFGKTLTICCDRGCCFVGAQIGLDLRIVAFQKVRFTFSIAALCAVPLAGESLIQTMSNLAAVGTLFVALTWVGLLVVGRAVVAAVGIVGVLSLFFVSVVLFEKSFDSVDELVVEVFLLLLDGDDFGFGCGS